MSETKIENDEQMDIEQMDTTAITSTQVLGRVNALLSLQDKQNELTEQMEKEILEIEKKYLLKFQPLSEKRFEIVSGKVEPSATEQECKEPIVVENLTSVPTDKGIPKFWLTVLKNTEIRELIEDCDAEALEYLEDIKIVQIGEENDYSLEFYFGENPYFTNNVITKTVSLIDDDLESIVSTPINWKDGKNFSTKTVKKQIKGKPTKGKASAASSATVQEMVPCFFSTFLSPQEEGDSEQAEETMYIQYQIIAKLKDVVIPNAVEFFLGRATDEEEDNYGGDYDFGDEDGEDFDDEDDEDEEPTPKRGGNKQSAKPQQPQDCKQQ